MNQSNTKSTTGSRYNARNNNANKKKSNSLHEFIKETLNNTKITDNMVSGKSAMKNFANNNNNNEL